MTDDSDFDDPSHNDHGDNSDDPKLTTEVNARRRQRPSSSPSEAHSGSAPRHVRSRSNDTPVRIRTRAKPTDNGKPPKSTRMPNHTLRNDEETSGTPSPTQARTKPSEPRANPKATRKRKNRKPNLPTELKGKGGYGDPPAKYQFKTGQSGNPKGRPKKDKQHVSEDDMFIKILSEKITITEQGQRMEVTKLEALVRSQVMAALSQKAAAVKHLGALWDLSKRLSAKPKNVEFTTQELDLLRSVFGDGEFEDLLEDASDNGDNDPDKSRTPDDDDDQGGQ